MYSNRTFATHLSKNDLSATEAQAADSCFDSIVSSLGQSTAASMCESFHPARPLTESLTPTLRGEEPQIGLPLMGRLNGPSVAPSEYVKHCKTYREAVRMAWQLRRVAYMTQRQLAAEAGLWPQMVTDYLNKDDAPTRRNLPAEKIPAFEAVVGNTVLTQWLAAQSSLTVMEETIANKEAA